MSQRAHWCLTVVEDVVNKWPKHVQDAWREQSGNQDTPLQIVFSEISYSLWIGHREGEDDNTKEPHYHVLLSCPSGRTATKSKAFNIMNSANFKLMGINNIYCQELQTTVAKYKNYIFKTSCDAKIKSVDGIISKAADRLKTVGNITKESLRKELIDQQGPSWYSKHKQVVETYIGAIDNFQTQRIVDVEEDMDEIVERTKNIIATFHDIVLRNIEENGYSTTHEFFKETPNDIMAKYITVISLLPYLFQRSATCMDNIPGLYFFGDAGAGKSMIFNMGRSYKMIASDSVGVSRFKLEGCQSAFLLDDIKASSLNDQTYMSTLRQLILGGFSRVKTHADTQQIKGFIAVTSNETPIFLLEPKDNNMKQNNDAWKRRFITLKFEYQNLKDFDRQGNEFDYTQSLESIATFIKNCYDYFVEENEKTEEGDYYRLIKTLTPYYNSLYKYGTTKTTQPVEEESSKELDVTGTQLLEQEEEERAEANFNEPSTSSDRKRTVFSIFKKSKKRKTTTPTDGLVVDITSGSDGEERESRAKTPTLEDGELMQSQMEDGEIPWTQTQSKNYNEDAFMR